MRAHRCFELSGRYQLDDPTWTLVHGVIVSCDLSIAHAWLKRDGWIFDAVLNESMPEQDYLTRFAAREIGSFSAVEAAQKQAARGWWGPLVDYPPDVAILGAGALT